MYEVLTVLGIIGIYLVIGYVVSAVIEHYTERDE